MIRIAILVLVSFVLFAQEKHASRNVWTGVFTAEQANRGLETYKQQCAMCHGETMSGGGGVPAVAGPEFLYSWTGKTAAELLDYLKSMMPPANPGSLSDQRYADVIAAIFQANNFPPSQGELSADSKILGEILITREKPAPGQ